MILAFGGTTEGRTAIEVLEEAGKPYYYSTRTDGQRVPLHHGIRLTGTMDANEMARFCRERDIRLLVDAAHPFAIELHRNVASTAQALGLPAIRLERLYPDTPATRLATWCQDYTEVVARLETLPVRRILALTGVQTIAPLRPLWDDPRREVYFRILDRADSHALVLAQGFPPDRLCHYHPGEDEALLMQRLRPDAIILKESGQSGGFLAKTEAACGLGIATFIVRRPPMPPGLACADGPHGLRRLVESLLPGFYDQRSGLTTGTCATASAVACVLALFCPEGEPRGTVPVILPDGETLHVAIAHSRRTSATCAEASTLKDGGDDPDVTNGLPLCATLSLLPPRPGTPPGDYDIDLRGGPGIGTVTLPGLGIAVGSPAINATPRRMILDNMARQLRRLGVCPARHAYRLALSAPGGEAAAARTLNPRLGIEGGISIIGTSGIVRPFSTAAYVDSISKAMHVARAMDVDRLVLNSGAKSERHVRALYPRLPAQAFVQYGNYIGQALRLADATGIAHVTLGLMIGKAVKLAEGHQDTHSRSTRFSPEFLARLGRECGLPPQKQQEAARVTLARQLWTLLSPDEAQAFAQTLLEHCYRHCAPLLPHASLTMVLIDEEGTPRGEIQGTRH